MQVEILLTDCKYYTPQCILMFIKQTESLIISAKLSYNKAK